MKPLSICRTLAFALAGFFLLAVLSPVRTEPPREKKGEPGIDFSRHIRPILSENCFACHGPDAAKRKAGLRLDTKEGAFAALRSGGRALVPGKPEESELIVRVSSPEPGEIMPPAKSGKHLKPEQIALLKRWVQEGAAWSEHWAFVSAKRQAVPEIRNPKSEIRNPIDAFIRARLEMKGLEPSPEADRVTLLRRVTLDLTGLPPTPVEVDAFLADQSADPYEKVVDRLLESSRSGEHMTRFWLDAARYGDTHGLHLDNYREIWPYRDWVIRAFNSNKRYDRFLIEQLAGDLLPSPTNEQMVATGFNRCNVTTSEGGSIEEEVFVRNVVDRTETMSTVFMGLTVGCARCHDHKYDPIKMKEFYSLFAFFNSLDGSPLDGNAARHEPTIRVATAEYTQKLAGLHARIDVLKKQLAQETAKLSYDESAEAKEPEELPRRELVWIDDALPTGAKAVVDGNINVAWNFVAGPGHPVQSGSKSLLLKAKGLRQVVIQDTQPGLRIGEGDRLFAHVWLSSQDPPKEIMLQWNSGQWLHRAYWGQNVIPWGRDNSTERRNVGALPKAGQWVRLEVDAGQVGLKPGSVVTGWAFTQHDGTAYWDRAGIITKTPQADQPFDTLTGWLRVQRAAGGVGLPVNIQQLVKLERKQRTPEQQKELRDYFVTHVWTKSRAVADPFLQQLAKLEQERKLLEGQMPATLVFRERAHPRPAYLLKRGEYDQRGEQVSRITPAALPPMPEGLPRNRLGLAEWLVSPGHPLTARVAVNRFWQQLFGTGLVKTAEDFGAQGEPPSHPELLDWLAVQFIEDGWDIKKTVRRMVTSATYRQSSRVTPDRLAKDPGNRLLSRGPRFRLDAEMLRDQALSISGLLVERVGGFSVKPPQPPGLWEAVGYTASNTARFTPDSGREKVHRRSLYIFWKRTAPPPQMSTFDAPSREACMVRRERTNTPLQALLLLNEPQFIESARVMAEQALRQGKTAEERITFLFRLATCRKPDAKDLAMLLAAYQEQLAEYRRDSEAAKKLINVGETKPDANVDPVELAAWTMVANVLLNLDEVLTKG
jgi:mono/diheme cytochrome c family protein